MKNITSLLLVIGILLVVNFLSDQFYLRFDLTEDKQYTLSRATKEILEHLKEQGQPLTVTAYFSENLPPEIAKTRRDFRDMLTEYSSRSGGYVNFEFVNPSTEEQKQTALQEGVQPVMINVREKDQMKAQQSFMGAVLKLGSQKDIIPVIQPGMAMEYALSTGIKKMSVTEKPAIALIQGHGEPPLSSLSQAYQQLSILYKVEEIDLNAVEKIDQKYKAVAILAPTDTIHPAHFNHLENYLQNGGGLMVGINAVEGDLQSQTGVALRTGLENWLYSKGLEVDSSFLIDANCGNVSIQQQQGFFTFQTPVPFPFLPLLSRFSDHPITKGIEQVMLPFASPLRFLGKPGVTFSPLVLSSAKSGVVSAPTNFDIVNRKWTNEDFPMSDLAVAGVLEGQLSGSINSRIVVVSDGDFCITGQQGQSPDNINLFVNALDWLSDDTGLIELRTKGVATRPILQMEDSTRSFWKYMNFGAPIFLVLVYGIYRFQRQRTVRQKRMMERFA